MALFTVALSLASIYQFIILNGQLEVMRKDQRAWIAAVPGTPETPQNGSGKLLMIPVDITNTGKTLARDVQVEIIVTVVKNGDQPKCEYGEKILETRRATRVFLPNEKRTFRAAILSAPDTDKDVAQPKVFSPDEVQQLTVGSKFFVVYGQVNYKDTFKKQHWVHFCRFGILNNGSTIVMLTAKPCSDYNEIDDG